MGRAIEPTADIDDHEDDDGECPTCGGDGLSTPHDHPEVWGEDACVEEDRVITCPDCHGKGRA